MRCLGTAGPVRRLGASPRRVHPGGLGAIAATLVVVACSEQPTGPSESSPGIQPPGPEFALIDDTLSVRGPLVDSVVISIPDTGSVSGLDTLWSVLQLADDAVLEVVADLNVNLGPDSTAATLLRFTPNPAIYYRSNGDLVFRPIEFSFYARIDETTTDYQSVSTNQVGDSVAFIDDESADHGMEVYWFVGYEEDLEYNFYTDGEPPECALNISFICYPPPPFDTLDTVDEPMSGTVVIRAFGEAGATPALALTADTTELHPWIRAFSAIGENGTLTQSQRVADTVLVTLIASAGAEPLDDVEVELTAEVRPRTGGHHHLDQGLLFSNAPLVQDGDAEGRPVVGYFKQGTTRVAALTDTTDSNGAIMFTFVAGFVGGDVKIVAEASLGGLVLRDSLDLRIRVPGLIDLETETTADDYAYLIGQVTEGSPPDTVHAADSIWHVTPGFGNALETLAAGMKRDSASMTFHLQLNDASLPFGGSFSVVPYETAQGQLIERAYRRGHRTHALGIDIDVAWCQVESTGDDGQAGRVTGTDCAGAPYPSVGVMVDDLETLATRLGLILLVEDRPGDLPHYHLRLQEGEP